MPTSLLNPLPAAHRHRHGRRLLFLVSSSSSSATSTTSSLSFSSLPQTNAKSKSKLLKVKAPLLPFSSRSHRPSAMDTSCKVQIITQERFSEDVLCSDLPVLVGFCADWCGPCKLIGPILDTVSKEFDGSMKTLKIDTDASPDLVKEYDVYGLPTLILFKDGKEVPKSRREGTINAKKLKELLDELLTTS